MSQIFTHPASKLMPFHLSISVADITSVKHFYNQVLNCAIGRDNGDWFDVNFYGHQLTIHQSLEGEVAVTIDHFGSILNKTAWLEVIEQCECHHIDFLLSPIIKNQGMENESGKLVVRDPAGNKLEFKFYQKTLF